MRKIISIILAVILLYSMFSVSAAENIALDDMDLSQYSYDDLKLLYDRIGAYLDEYDSVQADDLENIPMQEGTGIINEAPASDFLTEAMGRLFRLMNIGAREGW